MKTRIVKGSKVKVNWGFSENVLGEVVEIIPGGRGGNWYAVKLERLIMVYGQMSAFLTLRKWELTIC